MSDHQVDKLIDHTGTSLLAHLHATLEAREHPIAHLISALDEIMAISVRKGQNLLPRASVLEAITLLRRLAPSVSEAIAGGVSSDRIYFGLGSACALIDVPSDEFYGERQLHVAWLAAELRAYSCSKELSRRGDRLVRAVSARLAWEAPAEQNITVQ